MLVVSASATTHARRPAMVQDFAPEPLCYSKKSSRRGPARRPAQLLSKIGKSNHLARGRLRGVRPDPPFSSPSPPLTQCYRRGPFWPAYGATARAPLPSENPTCKPHAAPPQRLGPALTPVDAVPRRLPFREGRYSTWGRARAVLPSGTRAAAFKVGMLSIRPGTCRAGLHLTPVPSNLLLASF